MDTYNQEPLIVVGPPRPERCAMILATIYVTPSGWWNISFVSVYSREFDIDFRQRKNIEYQIHVSNSERQLKTMEVFTRRA